MNLKNIEIEKEKKKMGMEMKLNEKNNRGKKTRVYFSTFYSLKKLLKLFSFSSSCRNIYSYLY